MNTLTPSGRLSKVEKGDKVFQIQTEFFHRPRPKIASTVILNGKTINKIESRWEEELITDEDLKKIEKAIRKQHQKVILIIEDQETREDSVPTAGSLMKKPWEILAEVVGIENLVVANAKGKVLFSDVNSTEREAFLKILSPVNKLTRFLSQTTRLGDFLGGQIKMEKEKMVWIFQNEKLCIAFLNQYMDFDSFSEKVKKLNWSNS
jgi:hypothetical protein